MERTNDQDRPEVNAGSAPAPAPEPAPAPAANGDAADTSAPPPQLSLTGRLLNNWIYLLLAFAIVGLLLKLGWGWQDFLYAAMAALGLGLIIFVHELGHFLAAKWCDVHVQTFSIGFGPAIPGCSFVKGETTYKIAVLPLGGFVNMVGEGPEADEDENYPRSFKNKSVLQRMLIISAGVIMNMIFAAIIFVTVYFTVGERRTVAVIGTIDSGSVAWENSVRTGWRIVELDGNKKPFFDDVLTKVPLSQPNQKIPFTFEAVSKEVPDAPKHSIDLVPHRDENNKAPAIGIQSTSRLKLPPATGKKDYSLPVHFFSAAAAARSFDLKDGDVPLASTDPGSEGEVTPLVGKEGKKDPWLVLCNRLRKAAPEGTFVVRVRGSDGTEREVKAGDGFEFDDSILATTDPTTPNGPFNLDAFSVEQPDQEAAAAYSFRRRLLDLAGKPLVIQVKRDKGDVATILVPPAYHVTLGLRMKMGEVAALRKDSAAADAGVELGDVISKAELRHVLVKGERRVEGAWEALPDDFDPMRLPDELYSRVHKDPARRPRLDKATGEEHRWQVRLTVLRTVDHKALTPVLLDKPIDWDDSFKPGDEVPLNWASPLAIPQVGLAYRVDSWVTAVEPGSPAAEKKLAPGDEIRSIRYLVGRKTPSEKEATWTKWREMKNKAKSGNVYDQWAHAFYALQEADFKVVEVEVYRNGKKHDTVRLDAEPDDTWPMASRGISLMADSRRQTTSNLFEAIGMGLDKTWRVTLDIYKALTSLVSGQIAAESMGGPVEIASGVFSAARDPSAFLLLLGVISINLAVVNFLPIPILDGGHMVFLIYEGVRGKPPPESVRIFATYLGLAIILALMLFVFYNDFERRGWLELPGWLRR